MNINDGGSRRELAFEVAANRELEFAVGATRVQGSNDAPKATLGMTDVENTRFVASIADEVIAVSIEQLFADRGKPLPPDYKLYNGMYELWLVPHRVGILRKSGLREVT